MVRSVGSRLVSSYPAFTAYAALSLTQSAVLLSFTAAAWSSRSYAVGWTLSEIAVTGVYLASQWEAWRLTVRRYPDLGAFGRNVLAVLLAAALVISTVGAFADLHISPRWDLWLAQAFIVRRFLLNAGAGFVLLAWIASEILPAPSRRNFVIHRRILALHSTSSAVAQLAVNWYGPGAASVANLVHLSLAAGCWSVWATLMTPAGETEPPIPSREDGLAAAAEAERISDSVRGILDGD